MIAALAILAAGLSVAAHPESDPATGAEKAHTIRANAGQMLNLAEEMLRRGDQHDAETILDLLARDPDRNVRSEARFRQALLLEARGSDNAAAVLLRRILDDKPDATAVRFKLATMLQKMGHEDSALRELRALRTSELPPDVARFVDRLSTSLQATKPLGFQMEFALAPDSNINRATRSDTLGTIFGDFSLDQASQARSGVGATFRGFGQARHPLDADLAIIARASGQATLYRHKDFNDIAVDIAVGPEWRIGRARLSAELGLGRQWYGIRPFQRSQHLSASAARPIDSVSVLRLDGSVRRTDNRLNDLQDGRGYSAQTQYERALSADLLVAANAGIDRFKAKDAAYSTRSWNAGVSAYRDVGRMTLSVRVDFGRLKADERLMLLPRPRQDRLTRFTIASVLRRLTVAGFAPVARLIVERNRSTVEFYDFKRVRTEFGVSRAF